MGKLHGLHIIMLNRGCWRTKGVIFDGVMQQQRTAKRMFLCERFHYDIFPNFVLSIFTINIENRHFTLDKDENTTVKKYKLR